MDAPTSTSSNVNSTIRAVLTAVGTILVTTGVVSADKWGPIGQSLLVIIGALMPVASLVWSYLENRQQTKTLTTAIQAPAQEIKK